MKKVDDLRRVDAHPTKDFFVFMLTKDIELSRAINDLVDNAVDGATRARSKAGKVASQDYLIRVKIEPTKFTIEDNCGGIDLETARSYAFKFGRDPRAPALKHSIGQFGVGMKRALFKLGKKFSITSTTTASKFTIDVDVDKWSADIDAWDFWFKDFDENRRPASEAGTKIVVTNLNSGVAAQAEQLSFLKTMREDLAKRHQKSDVNIVFNGQPITFTAAELLVAKGLQPARLSEKLSGVDVEIFAGLAGDNSSPRDAGWSVFCNGRLILDADKTYRTGWGDRDNVGLPMFHPQYNRFRGYVFFDADSPKLLPWNTTKSDVDMDSEIYRGVRQKMISLARPVITFLNELKDAKAKAKNQDIDIEIQLKKATSSRLVEIAKKTATFKAPKIVEYLEPIDDEDVEITYLVNADQFEVVRKALKARSSRSVGEKTFDYYYSQECE